MESGAPTRADHRPDNLVITTVYEDGQAVCEALCEVEVMQLAKDSMHRIMMRMHRDSVKY